MSPIVEARNPTLWQGVRPEDIWVAYKAALEVSVSDLFRPDRERPVVELRSQAPRAESGRP